MFRRFFRGLITIIGGLIGYEVFDIMVYFVCKYNGIPEAEFLSPSEQTIVALVFIIIFAIISYLIAPVFTDRSRRAAASIENEIKGISAVEIIGGVVGLLLGLIISYFITTIYQNILVHKSLYLTVTVIVYSLLGFTLAVIGSRKAPELYNLIASSQQKKTKEVNEYDFNLKEKNKKDNRIPKILDTSVIIDGRVLEIMKAGFLEGPIIIPEFVLVELRHIADSSDSLKRVRGRRGLDILNKIQTEFEIQIYNTDQEKSLKEIPEVDVKLLKLAQIMKGKLVTNDFNLNKVAAIKNVPVLNINDLANAVKPISIPGEKMTVKLVKQGKDREQAVAYLDDGTMIVVEDGRKYIGTDVDITVTSVLQTSAGRMIFGKINK